MYNSTLCHIYPYVCVCICVCARIYIALCVRHPKLNFLLSPNICPLSPLSASPPPPLVTTHALRWETRAWPRGGRQPAAQRRPGLCSAPSPPAFPGGSFLGFPSLCSGHPVFVRRLLQPAERRVHEPQRLKFRVCSRPCRVWSPRWLRVRRPRRRLLSGLVPFARSPETAARVKGAPVTSS